MKTKKFLSAWSVALLLSGGISSAVLAQEAGSEAAGRTPQPRQSQPRAQADSQAESEADRQVGSQLLIFNSLGSGQALDVYRVQCNGQCTGVSADVADEGPFFDTIFKVCVIGSTSSNTGTQCRISPRGGLSAPARVNRSGFGSLRSFVTISEVNNAGAENYSTEILAFGFPGAFFNVTRILNQ
jgi:hypothetical protein